MGTSREIKLSYGHTNIECFHMLIGLYRRVIKGLLHATMLLLEKPGVPEKKDAEHSIQI